MTDEEWEAIWDVAERNDTAKAEQLWPGFTNPGGYILRLAIDAMTCNRPRREPQPAHDTNAPEETP
jgi:hypothetical protein